MVGAVIRPCMAFKRGRAKELWSNDLLPHNSNCIGVHFVPWFKFVFYGALKQGVINK